MYLSVMQLVLRLIASGALAHLFELNFAILPAQPPGRVDSKSIQDALGALEHVKRSLQNATDGALARLKETEGLEISITAHHCVGLTLEEAGNITLRTEMSEGTPDVNTVDLVGQLPCSLEGGSTCEFNSVLKCKNIQDLCSFPYEISW